MSVRAKKYLGQHFLNDEDVAFGIVNALSTDLAILEIGPGMGVLSKYLLNNKKYKAIEIDSESVDFLNNNYPDLHVIEGDFLSVDIKSLFDDKFAIIGNFPYNISSQILFKILEHRDIIPIAVGMFQKEVAERVASKPGNKSYGILSVFLQAYYDIEYLFTVDANKFLPPPKVQSGVIRIVRNDVKQLDCDEKLFSLIVKTAFNQRRKTLRNALASLFPKNETTQMFDKRAEQLCVADYVCLANILKDRKDKI